MMWRYTAAGMSAAGLIPYSPSVPLRPGELWTRSFVSAAYARLNVKIIGSDPGIAATLNSGTHMPLEDIGMMRCVPAVTIVEPADSVMLEDILRQAKELHHGVFYPSVPQDLGEDI